MQFKDHCHSHMDSPFFRTYADRFEFDDQRTEDLISFSPLDGDEIYRAFMSCHEKTVPTHSADETRELAESQFVNPVPPNQTSIDSYFVPNGDTSTVPATSRNDDFIAHEFSIQINTRTKNKKPDPKLRAKKQSPQKTHRYLTRARLKELSQANALPSNLSTPTTSTPQSKRSESSEKIYENSDQAKRQCKRGSSPETRDVKRNAVFDITRGMIKMAEMKKIPEFAKICKDLGKSEEIALECLRNWLHPGKSYVELSKILPKKKVEGESGTGKLTLEGAARNLCDAFFKEPYDEYFTVHYRHGGKVAEGEQKDLTSEKHGQRERKRREIFLRLKEEFKKNFEDPSKKAREGRNKMNEERILKTKDFSK